MILRLIIVFFLLFISFSSYSILFYNPENALTTQRVLDNPLLNSVPYLEGNAPNGVLIHPQIVLTCAHAVHEIGEEVAFFNTQKKRWWKTRIQTVFLDLHYFENLLQILNPIEFQTSGPQFIDNSNKKKFQIADAYDFQLLLLEREVPSSIASPIPYTKIIPEQEKYFYTISWGPIRYKSSHPKRKILSELDFEFLHPYTYVSSQRKREESIPHFCYIEDPSDLEDSFIYCELSKRKRKLDQDDIPWGIPVKGDSGAPLLMHIPSENRTYLVGIVSHGKNHLKNCYFSSAIEGFDWLNKKSKLLFFEKDPQKNYILKKRGYILFKPEDFTKYEKQIFNMFDLTWSIYKANNLPINFKDEEIHLPRERGLMDEEALRLFLPKSTTQKYKLSFKICSLGHSSSLVLQDTTSDNPNEWFSIPFHCIDENLSMNETTMIMIPPSFGIFSTFSIIINAFPEQNLSVFFKRSPFDCNNGIFKIKDLHIEEISCGEH